MMSFSIAALQSKVAAVLTNVGCRKKRAAEPMPDSHDALKLGTEIDDALKAELSTPQEAPSSQASTHSPVSDEASTGIESGPCSADEKEAQAAAVVPLAVRSEEPVRRRARNAELTSLCDCFMDLIGMEEPDDCVVRLVHRAIDLLFRCGYSVEDTCSVLAHASVYFMDAFEFCGARMEAREVGNILTVLMFLAHSYVLDETCPLRLWHSNLFRGYCTVKTLNAATLKLLEVRGWVLRVEPEALEPRHARLLQAIGIAEPRCPVRA